MATRPTTFARIFNVPTPSKCPVCGAALVTVDRPMMRWGALMESTGDVPRHFCATCGVFVDLLQLVAVERKHAGLVVLHRATPIRIHRFLSPTSLKAAKAWNRKLEKLLSRAR